MFTRDNLTYFTVIILIMIRYFNINHVLLNANNNKLPKYEKGYDWIFNFEYMISRQRKKQFVYAVPDTYVDLHPACLAIWEHNRRRLPTVLNPSNIILWYGNDVPDECFEDFRLESLQNFRFTDNIIAPLEDLARSGFYCLEDGWEIRCACCFSFYPFNCRFANAHSAHTRMNPNCPMLNDETVRNQFAATRPSLMPAPALPSIDECRTTTAIPYLTRTPEQVNPSNELRVSEVKGNDHTECDQPSVEINTSHDERRNPG